MHHKKAPKTSPSADAGSTKGLALGACLVGTTKERPEQRKSKDRAGRLLGDRWGMAGGRAWARTTEESPSLMRPGRLQTDPMPPERARKAQEARSWVRQ